MIDTVWMDPENNLLCCIDQNQLPEKEVILRLYEVRDVFSAIQNFSVSGGSAVGVAAAIGLYAVAVRFKDTTKKGFFYSLEKTAQLLKSSLPTSFYLSLTIDRMLSCAMENKKSSITLIKEALKKEALNIYKDDIEICKQIGINGLTVLKDGYSLLTHGNVGELSAVKYGSALAPVYVGNENGINFKVYVGETRPMLQGARLAAYELLKNEIDTTLVCDNVIADLMSKEGVDAVVVSCERVAANGDAISRAGTLGIAVLCDYYDVPFYICMPHAFIDPKYKTGPDLPAIEREPEKVNKLHFTSLIAPEGIQTYSPGVEIIPAKLITGFVTEKGVYSPKDITENIG